MQKQSGGSPGGSEGRTSREGRPQLTSHMLAGGPVAGRRAAAAGRRAQAGALVLP